MTLSINLRSIHCKTESDEDSDSDEPYVLVTTVQLLPVPDVRTFLYGPWEMDDGDTRTIVTEPPFWGLDSVPTNILAAAPPPPPPPVPVLADLFFLVTVMENDAGEPAGYRQYVQTMATAALAAAAPLGANRPAQLARILTDVRSGLDGHPANNVPFVPSDDHVGTVQLVLGPSDLIPAGFRDKTITIDGGDEGSYELTFRIGRHSPVSFAPDAHLAAVSRHPAHLEVWGVDTSGMMRGNWLDGRWHGWYGLAGAGFDQRIVPAAVARDADRMEVWAVGTDGHVRGAWFEDGSWHGWYALDGLVGGDRARFRQETTLAAVSRHPNHMEVFGIDEDGVLRNAWFDDGRWNGWGRIELPGGERLLAGAPISALSRHGEHMEVWTIDDREEIRGAHFLEGSWRNWITFAGAHFPRRGRLASVSRHENHMELLAVDTNGILQGNNFDDGAWHGWYPFPGAFVPGADVATASRHRDRMEVWLVGKGDGIVRGDWYDEGIWHGWYLLDSGGTTFRPDSDLTAVSRSHVRAGLGGFGALAGAAGPEAMELWSVDPGGTVRGNWFDGQWHPWYVLPWSFEG